MIDEAQTSDGAMFYSGTFFFFIVKKCTVLKLFLYFCKYFVCRWKITKKCVKSTKNVENSKKVFQPAFGYAQHLNAGQNTQQTESTKCSLFSILGIIKGNIKDLLNLSGACSECRDGWTTLWCRVEMNWTEYLYVSVFICIV